MKLFIKAVEARNEAEMFKLEKLVIFVEGFNNKKLSPSQFKCAVYIF